MRKIWAILGVAALVVALAVVPASAANANDSGGGENQSSAPFALPSDKELSAAFPNVDFSVYPYRILMDMEGSYTYFLASSPYTAVKSGPGIRYQYSPDGSLFNYYFHSVNGSSGSWLGGSSGNATSFPSYVSADSLKAHTLYSSHNIWTRASDFDGESTLFFSQRSLLPVVAGLAMKEQAKAFGAVCGILCLVGCGILGALLLPGLVRRLILFFA